jgi:TetR/AcrR family transcriptional regulator, cholesterol catabolism regulator
MKASSRQVRRGGVTAAPTSSRDRLLAAAARLFEEKGYGAVTVGEIAQAAQVSRPTAYRHFADKEDMLWVLTEQAGEHVLSIIARVASSSASPSQQIRELVRNHASAFVKHRLVFRLALRTQLELNPVRGKELLEAQRRYLEFTANVIDAGIRQGEFRPVHPKTCAEGLLAMVGSVIDWFRPNGPLTLEEVADQFVELALNGLQVDDSSSG